MSVLALASLLLTGCIIPEAPEYGDPRMGRVYLDPSSVDPPQRSVLFTDRLPDGAESVVFKVKVHSEDAGERLAAVLYVDYKHTGGYPYWAETYDPLTIDEERTISFEFRLRDLDVPSCHVITLMVMHELNYDRVRKLPIGAPFDLASSDWLVVAQNETSKPDLESCPNNTNQE